VSKDAEQLLRLFREVWTADYIDFYFDRREDSDFQAKFIEALEHVANGMVGDALHQQLGG